MCSKIASTPGAQQQLDPAGWREHRFGLPPLRWAQFRDKSFWVTGAGSGYGRSIALALAAAGAQVFLSGRRLARLEESCAQAKALGINAARCIPVPLDITRCDEIEHASGIIAKHTAHLYGLVNNAALAEPESGRWPLADLQRPRWDRLLATNLTGQWLVSQSALPLMARGAAFRMLFMSSEAGWAGTPGFGPYNVSKAALNSLGMSLAEECGVRFPGKDIQINVLAPGEARTEMNQVSDVSPFAVVYMTLLLLSHPAPGPNGCFFHRDGRHLAFGHARPFGTSLVATKMDGWHHRLGLAPAMLRLVQLLRRRQ